MKQFLIKYSLKNASPEQWHADIKAFIAALDEDPELRGAISYRCMKRKDGADYYHLAQPQTEAAVQALQSRDFFKRYNEQTRAVAGGEVEVIPLEIVAETA
jgi:hypothetical protein